MRALGPGSVSSFLKVILDVFYAVLWTLLAVIALFVLASLLLSFRPDILNRALTGENARMAGAWAGPLLAGVLTLLALYVGGAIVIVGRLRRIFRTLIAGDPFQPDNVRRLRIISLTLAILELGRYAAAGIAHLLAHVAPLARLPLGGGVSLTTWFAVLVILVLAEVFKEGARLRGEAELTI